MDLNTLVMRFEETGPDEEQLAKLVGDNAEIFFPIVEANRDLPIGPLSSNDIVRIPLVSTEQGQMALFYTTNSDDRLGPKFGGAPLKKALEMVIKMSGADGMVIQSDKSPWIVIDRDGVASLLAVVSR